MRAPARITEEQAIVIGYLSETRRNPFYVLFRCHRPFGFRSAKGWKFAAVRRFSMFAGYEFPDHVLLALLKRGHVEVRSTERTSIAEATLLAMRMEYGERVLIRVTTAGRAALAAYDLTVNSDG